MAKHFKFSLDTPFEELPKKVLDAILYGTDEAVKVKYENREGTGRFEYESRFPGILADLKRRYLDTQSEGIKQWLERFMSEKPCDACDGKRLRPEALAVTVGGIGINDLSVKSVEETLSFISALALSDTEKQIAKQILKEISARLSFMRNVGLEYLTLERKAATLSGGEAQRIRLATQIGASLVGVLYILDEPSIGLHQRDNQRLIDTLTFLRDIGNTLIVVEHDEQTLRTADWIVDLGPGAARRRARGSPGQARGGDEEQEERHRPVPLGHPHHSGALPSAEKGTERASSSAAAASTTSRVSTSSFPSAFSPTSPAYRAPGSRLS